MPRHCSNDAIDPERTFLHRIGKGLEPGSLSQKQIDLFGKNPPLRLLRRSAARPASPPESSGGIVLQKEVISPGKRYETSTGDPGRNLTARIDRDHQVVTHMHDERWHLYSRQQPGSHRTFMTSK